MSALYLLKASFPKIHFNTRITDISTPVKNTKNKQYEDYVNIIVLIHIKRF